MKAKVWHLRCVACGEILYGADLIFCGLHCQWNGKYPRSRPTDSMREEEYELKKSRAAKKAVRNWPCLKPLKLT